MGALYSFLSERGLGKPWPWVPLALQMLALLMGLAHSPAALAKKPPETLDPTASCATGNCHTEIESLRYLHWPDLMAPGECSECHVPIGETHKFRELDMSNRCLHCHEDLKARLLAEESKEHTNLEQGCIECHYPHGGSGKALLKGVEEGDERGLCFRCHEEDIAEKEHVHDPIAEGECTSCHDPHTSSKGWLLREDEGPELCKNCHKDFIQQISTAKHLHEPVGVGCSDCHDSHSASRENLLLGTAPDLCGECHDELMETLEKVTVDHEALDSKESCLVCHDAHFSEHAGRLVKPERELCLSCHDEPVMSGDRQLLDMKLLLRKNKNWHKPIREDGCSRCHKPHGGKIFRMLVKEFPESLYSDFSVESYALCFDCHKEEMVTQKQTTTSTGFRDGNRNLHYLHVNREKRGRTCRVCHDMHASKEEFQLRKYLLYGNWWMPINFNKMENGGSCMSGCHLTRSYDRNRKGESN